METCLLRWTAGGRQKTLKMKIFNIMKCRAYPHKNLTLPKGLSGVGSWHWLQKRRCQQAWENKVLQTSEELASEKEEKKKNQNQHLHPDIQPTPYSQGSGDQLLFREGRAAHTCFQAASNVRNSDTPEKLAEDDRHVANVVKRTRTTQTKSA